MLTFRLPSLAFWAGWQSAQLILPWGPPFSSAAGGWSESQGEPNSRGEIHPHLQSPAIDFWGGLPISMIEPAVELTSWRGSGALDPTFLIWVGALDVAREVGSARFAKEECVHTLSLLSGGVGAPYP
jgi:hypothetical protein